MEDFMLHVLGGVVGAITVDQEETDYRISRGEYLGWYLASIVIIFGLTYLSWEILDDAAMVMVVPGMIALSVFMMRKAVQRARDAKLEKRFCYFICVPYIGSLFAIYLMFTSGDER